MSFAFFGTPHFSVIVLEDLLRAGYHPALVVTSPDKPVGRKRVLTPSPVKEFAVNNGLNVVTPKNNEELQKLFHVETQTTRTSHENRAGETHNSASLQKKCGYDFGILVAYGTIIPLTILDLFPAGILNIHPSLLPKYRGSTPLQTAILNGDTDAGVTIIKLNEKIDCGDIVAQEKAPILPTDTTQSLGEKLFKLGAKKLIEILPDYLDDKIKPQSQRLDVSKHRTILTKKFSKQDGFVSKEDLQKAMGGDKELSLQIDRKARAFTPWPGIWTLNRDGKRVLITKCHLENEILKIDWMKKEGENEEKFNASLFAQL